jgi:acyl-CoA synthetase (NDP forming)
MADACIAAGLEVPTLDAESRACIDKHLPSYGTSQNPVDGTAQAIHALGYAGMAELVLDSPSIDSVIVVMSGRAGERVVAERDRLMRVKAASTKPILMWSYTLPVPHTLTTLAETGYPIFTNMRNCARTLAVMTDYRAAREAALRTPDIRAMAASRARRRRWAAGPVCSCPLCWSVRPPRVSRRSMDANKVLEKLGLRAGSRAVLTTGRSC